MKRILYFTIIYILSLLLGTFAFATLFMFSCNLTMFITGLPAHFFSLNYFMSGILLGVPLVCVITQILLVLYLIRHPSSQFISLILYLVFGFVSWIVLIPSDLKLISHYDAGNISARTEGTSTRIFRNEDTGVFYYSKINEDGTADGLFFDTTGFLGQEGTVLPLFSEKIKNDSAYPYSDILIKKSLQPDSFLVYPFAIYNSLLTAASFSSSLGFLAWLSFASLGLALISIYGFQFASSWKLSNVVFVITAAAFIVFFNYFYYMNLLPDVLKEVASKLAGFVKLKDPLIVIINVLISIVFTVFGTFMGIYRIRGLSALENEE